MKTKLATYGLALALTASICAQADRAQAPDY
jgi:hypothetical protein